MCCLGLYLYLPALTQYVRSAQYSGYSEADPHSEECPRDEVWSEGSGDAKQALDEQVDEKRRSSTDTENTVLDLRIRLK